MNHSEQFPSCNPKGPQFSTVVLVCKLLSKKNTNSSLWFRCEIQLLSLLSALKHQGNRFSTHYLVIWNRIHEGNGRLLTATREHRDSSEELVILGLKFGAFPAPPPSQHADVLQSEYIDFPFRSKQQPNWIAVWSGWQSNLAPGFKICTGRTRLGKSSFRNFFSFSTPCCSQSFGDVPRPTIAVIPAKNKQNKPWPAASCLTYSYLPLACFLQYRIFLSQLV